MSEIVFEHWTYDSRTVRVRVKETRGWPTGDVVKRTALSAEWADTGEAVSDEMLREIRQSYQAARP